jgi:Rrf2 family protein
MKLITRDTDYAVRALCYIARQRGQIVSVNELVDCLNVPKPFIRKLLQILNKKGILKSYKGKGGGFTLAADNKNITLVGIIEIFQGPLRLSDHNFKKSLCHDIQKCPLKKKLDKIEDYVRSELGQVTVAYLLERGKEQ